MDTEVFDADGFYVTAPVLGADECAAVVRRVADAGNIGIGKRNLLDYDWCKNLAQALKKAEPVNKLLPAGAVAVQCTYFEKSADQNWLVPLHQDLSIPVRTRTDHPSLSGWSEKDGCIFVQPPVEVLKNIVAVRLHLDECGNNDGPLKVVPGSHQFGRLSNDAALEERRKLGEHVCVVKKGAALVMRPLLLHASSKAAGNSRRRVLHFVFGQEHLPLGLQWQHAV